MLYHIVAMAQNRVIGKNNQLPWHFKEDLNFFKKTTLGSTIIMGRKTYESIGRPLPGRENYVLTRSNPQAAHPLVKYFDSMDKAIVHATTANVFIIGGASLFGESMDQIDGIYLTQIHAEYEGDVGYPLIPHQFVEKSRTCLREDPRLEVVYYEKQKKAS